MDVIRPLGAGQWTVGRIPAIICTDIGHDPDDLLALILAAAALPLRLVVTCDEFGGGQRAKLARLLLNLCGRTGVVVVAGAEIEGAHARWVCDGLVPAGFPPASAPVTGSVVDAVRAVLGETRRAVWIGQGPLSNLARLYSAAPGLARRLTVMQSGGGFAHLSPDPSRASHNLRLDPVSARTVLTAPDLDVSLVTSDITLTSETAVDVDCAVYQRLAAANAPKWAKLVAAGYDRWFASGHSVSMAADPLTVTAAAGMGLVEFATQRVTIASDAHILRDPDGVALPTSVSADYAAIRAWVSMVVRHALDAGMGYAPGLIENRPEGPAAVAAASSMPIRIR